MLVHLNFVGQIQRSWSQVKKNSQVENIFSYVWLLPGKTEAQSAKKHAWIWNRNKQQWQMFSFLKKFFCAKVVDAPFAFVVFSAAELSWRV